MLVQQQKQENAPTLSNCKSNPVYYNDMQNIILLSNDDNNLKIGRADLLAVLSFFENNLTTAQTLRAAQYFLKVGAACAVDLINYLKIPESTVYRIFKNLQVMGLIEPYTKLTVTFRRGGPRPVLYAIKGVTSKEIATAADRYLKQSSKNYVYVDQVYQSTLNQIIEGAIQYRKIYAIAKNAGNRGFRYQDIADLVALMHQENGVKVWR